MDEPKDLDDAAVRDRAVRAARGEAPFDVLVTGGTLADVATSEFRPADIGIVGGLIASVHPTGTRRDAGQTIDASNRVVAPGLIDTHMHIESSMLTPRRYAETVVPQGTTTVCWDPHELGNVLGLDGVSWAVAASRGLPLRVLVMAPSCVPSAPGLELAGATFGAADMETMLAWPEVIGVAEVMDMQGVLRREPHMVGIVGAGLAAGKLVCGHARGLAGVDVQGFAVAGLQSDHEITSGADLLEKLRAGFTVELRGSHDYVLPGAVAALATLAHVPQTVTICTDDVFPDDLVAAGGMRDVLRRLIGHGMRPIDALRCATLNAAMRLGRRDLGLVAPGRRADLVIFTDLTTMIAETVLASGVVVAERGRLCGTLRPDPVAPPRHTMHLAPMVPADFDLRATGASVALRTVNRPRFTEWGFRVATVENGVVLLPEGTIMMAVVHRHGRAPATPVLGVLEGWSTWRGAIATTVAHDSHNLVVFGREPADMAAAANAVIASGGGMAVAAGGAVTALLKLPVCGLIADASAAEVAAGFATLKRAADRVVDWQPPVLTFKALVGAALACNPGPHVTDRGIADGTTGAVFASALAVSPAASRPAAPPPPARGSTAPAT